ncbi:sensor histidine kinase [Tamlana crocina]|uniref:histidine kinase n=1 Tax=Tamlana crocina TaxID=393006 RepID=A0ABX1DAZ3_9FLAO|nr:ATP-binding protein [Tamlana crocina]NJX14208.1 two-component sensor histidine kinase [Tamlana crocina]
MNSLLKRQIRKYLSEEQASDKNMEQFLNAIGRSYNNYDEQFNMLQRSMQISSEELFTANKKLEKEAQAQQEVIDKLKNVIETLKFYELPENIASNNSADLDGLKLVNFIDNQTKEIIKINQQRENLMSELEHQNEELSDYAHVVSHDLKSPLRSIDTLSTWLNQDYKDSLDVNGVNNIKQIRSHVEKMDKLISGILEYTAISKNKIEFYDVDTDKLVDDVIKMIEVPPHISIIKRNKLPIVKGDKYRLQQLFQNLITNAINYNDKAEGIIEIGLKDEGKFWQFYVKDNGKGIKETYFDKIFKIFQKLENDSKSTGVGLSIVKKIIELFGGKIWLESTLGVGTTFYFTLKKKTTWKNLILPI